MSLPVPQWPSLYNPGLEILNIQHREPTQPGGAYLERPGDVFRFTFYWTLIFNTPFFLFCGAYAFWNYTLPPRPSRSRQTSRESGEYQLVSLSPKLPTASSPTAPVKLPRVNERRSRVTFAVIVLLVFLASTLAGSVIGSALLGFITAGLYKAGGFYMSTWVPFLLAVLQTLIGLLSVWPSIIEII